MQSKISRRMDHWSDPRRRSSNVGTSSSACVPSFQTDSLQVEISANGSREWKDTSKELPEGFGKTQIPVNPFEHLLRLDSSCFRTRPCKSIWVGARARTLHLVCPSLCNTNDTPAEVVPGSVKLAPMKKETKPRRWTETQASRADRDSVLSKAPTITEWKAGLYVVSVSGDVCKVDSWVFARMDDEVSKSNTHPF